MQNSIPTEKANEKIEDKVIDCKTCQKEFVWSAKEQKYYQKKGFRKKPQKCNSCREKANKLRDNSMFYIHCGICDTDGVMLSPPPKDRVGICDNCFKKLAQKYSSSSAISSAPSS